MSDALFSLRANQPLILRERVWRVVSGALAVFAVESDGSETHGARRYLFDLGAGELIFGLTSRPGEPQWAILAVPLRETVFSEVGIDEVRKLFRGEPCDALAGLERWVGHLCSLLGSLAEPPEKQGMWGRVSRHVFSAASLLDPNAPRTLQAGEWLDPSLEGMVWVRVLSGELQWFGRPDLTQGPIDGAVPVSRPVWFHAATAVEVVVKDGLDPSDANEALRGMHAFRTRFFRGLDVKLRVSERRILEKSLQSEQRTRRLQEEARGKLGELLGPGERRFTWRSSDLFSAACAVAESQGIALRPPWKAEDLKKAPNPIEAIARASHVRIRRVILREQWWNEDSGPLLAHLKEDGRAVALIPSGPGCYELYDPTGGISIRVTKAVEACLERAAHTFYRPLPEGVLGPASLLRFALFGSGRLVASLVAVGVLGTIMALFTPFAMSVLIDIAIPYTDRRILAEVALGLGLAAFGSAMFRLSQGFLTTRLETSWDALTQSAVWDRLLRLNNAFFRRFSSGDLLSRVTAISQMRQKLGVTTLQTIFTALLSLLSFGLLLYYSLELASIAAAIAATCIAVSGTVGWFIFRTTRQSVALTGEFFGILVQLIRGVSMLRVAGAEERAFAYWGKNYSRLLAMTLREQALRHVLTVFNAALPIFGSVAVFVASASLLSDPRSMLSAGSFLAFNAAFGTFISASTTVSDLLSDLFMVVVLAERVRPILAEKPEVDASKADPGRLVGQFGLGRVSFRYRQDGPLILDEVSLEAKPGEFIAIVGPSGSGKSTILRLLLGFEKPVSGAVLFDGQELAGLDLHAVRRQLGVVLQDGQITGGSILEIISAGAMMSMEAAERACKAAGLEEDIHSMPMGMHTLISEGGRNLSGGQRQRLLIARALANEPRILLLDEATSALDNMTQAVVSDHFQQMRVTRVAIAHRLSTIRGADRIYVLDQGRVVQVGTYDELSTGDGLFRRLIARQMLEELSSFDTTTAL